MSDGAGRENQMDWAPSPFVTHREMGGVHRQIGALEQGQTSILASYNHLRGDMLNGFDRMNKSLTDLAAAITEQAKQQAEQQSRAAQVEAKQRAQNQDENSSKGITLTLREAVLALVAVMLATMVVTYSGLKAGIHPGDVKAAATQVLD